MGGGLGQLQTDGEGSGGGVQDGQGEGGAVLGDIIMLGERRNTIFMSFN